MFRLTLLLIFTCSTFANPFALKNGKSGRCHVRMPLDLGSYKVEITKPKIVKPKPVKITFQEFWKTMTCDINCKKPADQCSYIAKYKHQVAHLWEKTSQTSNVKVFIFRKGGYGKGLGFRFYEL